MAVYTVTHLPKMWVTSVIKQEIRNKLAVKLFSRMFSRPVTSRMIQSQNTSTFNTYSFLKARPHGIRGDTY